MTKKSLGDLLREEAQQPPDPEAEAIQKAASEPLKPDSTLSETESINETTDDPPQVNTAATRAKRIPTKAELETTVSELSEALQAAHNKESSLQQQIADLQSDLQEQKILLQKLVAELEPTNQLKAELDQAKKVILQLLEANSKTTQEANTPKKENKEKENKGISSQKLGLKRLPYHSIQPDSPSGKTFERNVGWFD